MTRFAALPAGYAVCAVCAQPYRTFDPHPCRRHVVSDATGAAGRVVLGVDPGGAGTGICVVRDGVVLAYATVDLGEPVGTAALVRPDYLRRVVAACQATTGPPGPAPGRCTVIERLTAATGGPPDIVAVEDLNSPGGRDHNGRVSPIQPAGLLAAAAVAGAVATWADLSGLPVATVPPGRNGSSPLSVYPSALVPPRTTAGTSDRLRHVRSAYDVARTAGRG